MCLWIEYHNRRSAGVDPIDNSLKLKYLKIINTLGKKVKYFSYCRGKVLTEPCSLGNAAENISFLQEK